MPPTEIDLTAAPITTDDADPFVAELFVGSDRQGLRIGPLTVWLTEQQLDEVRYFFENT
jgi:hypothetical protein